ncbi:MAG: MBL fold metallo-hydrolase [Leptospirales bacterium]
MPHVKIKQIDCHYIEPRLCAAWIVKTEKSVAIIETGTRNSVPYILDSLAEENIAPESVDIIIITHVHLDHAGGAAELLKYCKNATLLCHPRCAHHLSHPSRLVAAVKSVYGERDYQALYGDIEPLEKHRIHRLQEEPFAIKDLTFDIIYTEGHASHHLSIYEPETKTVFTGDAFGVAYPFLQVPENPFIIPATTPTEFYPEKMRTSIQKIQNTGAKKAMLTHYGPWGNIQDGADQLNLALNEIEKIIAEGRSLSPDDYFEHVRQRFSCFIYKQIEKRQIQLKENEKRILEFDLKMNAMGISHSMKKEHKPH